MQNKFENDKIAEGIQRQIPGVSVVDECRDDLSSSSEEGINVAFTKP